jgi:hypothetical protein
VAELDRPHEAATRRAEWTLLVNRLHSNREVYQGQKSEIRNWKFEMSDIAIRAENLSKLYRIGPRLRYRTLRDTLTTDSETAPHPGPLLHLGERAGVRGIF